MVKVNEGGSVLSFVVIGVVMVVLLLGGVYFVRQRIVTQAASPTPTTDTNQTTNELPGPRKDEPAKEEANKKPTTSSEQSAQPTAGTTLPQTGPVETLTVIVALALLSGTFTAYLRSRRLPLSL